MNNDLTGFFIFIGMGYFIYFFTRAFTFTHEEHQSSDVRKSALTALMALSIGWILISGLFFLLFMQGVSASKNQEFGPWNVIRQAMIGCLFLTPVVVMMKRRQEALSSAGITKQNFGKSVLLGIILSVFMFLFGILMKRLDIGDGLHSIPVSDFWGLMTFLVVGITEEFGFRGYLQTRLMSWLGEIWGWATASVLMAVAHIVQRSVVMGMSGVDAIGSSLSLLPISLLYGFLLLRTKSIAAGTIFHAFTDWFSVVYFA